MTWGDGDRFVRCERGHTHWGRHGAAGLLVHHDGHVLLQHRAELTLGGGTWGVFGGARNKDEDPVAAALRETAEESTLDAGEVTVHALMHEDHGGWAYDTAIATVPALLDVRAASWESKDAAWVPVEEVAGHNLFGPFANAWPRLRGCLRRPVLVVDAANVMGSRADGWWRDRAGAAARLRDEFGAVDAYTGMAPFDTAFPAKVLVVEGKARHVDAGDTDVRVVPAPTDGDDTIVATVAELVAEEPTVACVVVTADRELKARCKAEGAATAGPRWLLDQL
ncbi:MAG: NUDIX domain-containing protein [Actinophytocola sp.]|uniref:NUDIX domain-containing protein n=1 Tax=Actinophytocola sp. TaxID=1872138 RepID=UPI00132C9CC4|nr:NUDIX domain-containing protein [Actinophytocola sp.]MPZ85878.1 NUDIX domain-containing protein [Actinophytocola sp.]